MHHPQKVKESGKGPGPRRARRRLLYLGVALALAVALVLAAAGLLLAGFRLPLWHLRMEAPQYRGEDALHVIVYPHTMRGDLQELAVLNQYIGVPVP